MKLLRISSSKTSGSNLRACIGHFTKKLEAFLVLAFPCIVNVYFLCFNLCILMGLHEATCDLFVPVIFALSSLCKSFSSICDYAHHVRASAAGMGCGFEAILHHHCK